jgi:1-acyl-sn-glycerol-3-phosphate acyltransferase
MGLKRAVGGLGLRLAGWRLEGEAPPIPKYVLLGAPHTSNWDFAALLAVSLNWEISVAFVAKHTLFRGPAGPVMRALGGIPIDRRAPRGLVGQIVEEFRRRDRLVVTITPEGTRGATDRWRSGFYRIATEAGVPIVPGFVDYANKRAGFGPPLYPSGNVKADMDVLRAFYADKTGKFPDHAGRIWLEAEG